MKLTLGDFILKSRQASNLQELCDVLEKTLAGFGFNNWAYQLVNAAHETEKKPVIFANYPENWVTHYIESSYHKIDPVILQGPQQVVPFTWLGLTPPSALTKPQKTFYHEAAEHGLPDGVGIPVHGGNGAYAMISMSSPLGSQELTKMMREHMYELHLISLTFHTVARDLITLDMVSGPRIELTPREKECLTWVGAGKTAWETGEILKLSEATVKYFLANARTKLGVYSTREAVVKAYMMGLIRL